MSCNTINYKGNTNYEDIGPHGNATGYFAPLDLAFSPSQPMNDFQTRMVNHNPLFANVIYSDQDKKNDILLISPQTEEKINSNVDEIVSSLYKRDNDIAKQISSTTNRQYLYPHVPTVQDGIPFPLSRNQYYSTQRHGSELLEDFNLQQDIPSILNDTNSTSYNITGMNFFKFILLLILISVLVYGGYWLYKNDQSYKTSE